MKKLWNPTVISLLYVGIGTICLFGASPSGLFYFDYSYVGIFITLPVTVISFGIIYTSTSSITYILVFIIQIIMFKILQEILRRKMSS